MLVAIDVQRHAFANNFDRVVARRLRPAARIKIGFQVSVVASMMSRNAGEYSLAEQDFHRMATPVIGPVLEEIFLSLPKQNQTRFVKRRSIEILVFHMIRSAAGCVDFSRTALPLSICDDRKTDIAVNHVPEVDADVLFDGCGVVIVRVVTAVGFVNRVDHPGRFAIATFGNTFAFPIHRGSCFSPDVALKDIVIVWQADRWRIFHRVAKRPTVHVVLTQVIQNRPVCRIANQTKPAVVFVKLVTGKVQHVRIKTQQVFANRFVREAVVFLASQCAKPQWPA